MFYKQNQGKYLRRLYLRKHLLLIACVLVEVHVGKSFTEYEIVKANFCKKTQG